MSDFWDNLPGGNPGAAPAGGNDPAAITSYFQQKTGRAPTDAELAAYVNGTPNFQQEIDANVAAPNGYGNLLKYGNVQGDPASGSQFGALPATYAPDAAASGILRQQYVAPQFTEAAPTFTAPTVGDIQNDPGVAYGEARAIRAQQNSAAAKGTVLNAQTTAALGRDVQDYSNTQFNNVYNRAATTFDKNLATYGAKYNVFTGNAGLADAADTKNKTAAQQIIANGQNAYTTNFNANETSQTDYWNRLNDVANRGANASAQ